MATEIYAYPSANDASDKVHLIAKLKGHGKPINKAQIMNSCEAVISISEDKTVIIWQQRETGAYIPSVCHVLRQQPTCMAVCESLKLLYVGLENGCVSQFSIAEDFNKLTYEKNFMLHSERVTDLHFWPERRILLSVGKDKNFVCTCAGTGRRLAILTCTAPCTSLQFDEQAQYAFVGDVNGEISMLQLNEQNCTKVTSLKGHSACIRRLAWDSVRQMLYSASNDQIIICWDIGGKRGTAYELQGHTGRVSAVSFSRQPFCLISGSEDHTVIFWNMRIQRKETPEWLESDHCQRCSRPFFWNIKAMVDQKKIGLRQHHCRKCGKAVCDSCSGNRSTYPPMGFEFKVRVCDDCYSIITDQDRISLAKFMDCKHIVMDFHFHEQKKLLLTYGTDEIIKLWDVSGLCA